MSQQDEIDKLERQLNQYAKDYIITTTGGTTSSTTSLPISGTHTTTGSSTSAYVNWYSIEPKIWSTIYIDNQKCTCCKKVKTSNFLIYKGKKVERYICSDCVTKKFDKMFGIKSKVEDVIFD